MARNYSIYAGVRCIIGQTYWVSWVEAINTCSRRDPHENLHGPVLPAVLFLFSPLVLMGHRWKRIGLSERFYRRDDARRKKLTLINSATNAQLTAGTKHQW